MSWNPYKDRRDLRSSVDAATDRISDQSEEIVRLHGMVESRDQRLRAKSADSDTRYARRDLG